MVALSVLALICLLAYAAWFPAAAIAAWILTLETSPDIWLNALIGGHETIIAVLKAAGLILAALLAVRFGARADRYNPGFAFITMFVTGLAHGLYPGLTFAGSLRSLAGSAAPFAFGFTNIPPSCRRAVLWSVLAGPTLTIAWGAALAAAGLHGMFDVEQGALRLGGSGEPPFLAGFALIAVYAALFETLGQPSRVMAMALLLNLAILVLSGARAPLGLAVLLTAGTLLLQRRFLSLAAAGAVLSLLLIFANAFAFLRVINLTQLGEATDLSNRGLVWPVFEQAIARSPWVGWGVGAGKVVVPNGGALSTLIGTNAAHNEYLRIGVEGGYLGLALLIVLLIAWLIFNTRRLAPPQRWLIRAIFAAFAIHSATDNTLIATTSSVFFIWVSTVFSKTGGSA